MTPEIKTGDDQLTRQYEGRMVTVSLALFLLTLGPSFCDSHKYLSPQKSCGFSIFS